MIDLKELIKIAIKGLESENVDLRKATIDILQHQKIIEQVSNECNDTSFIMEMLKLSDDNRVSRFSVNVDEDGRDKLFFKVKWGHSVEEVEASAKRGSIKETLESMLTH